MSYHICTHMYVYIYVRLSGESARHLIHWFIGSSFNTQRSFESLDSGCCSVKLVGIRSDPTWPNKNHWIKTTIQRWCWHTYLIAHCRLLGLKHLPEKGHLEWRHFLAHIWFDSNYPQVHSFHAVLTTMKESIRPLGHLGSG